MSDTMLKPPVMAYEAIAADIEARGLKATDLLGADGHYDAWHRRKRLPATDSEGKGKLSSQEFYRAYREDPEGADACPPRADLWHFLLKTGEPVEWKEGKGERSKTVPICTAMFADPPDLTDEQLAAGRKRLEAASGRMSDEAWGDFARDARGGPAAARRCIAELHTVLERHGEPHPQFGHMLQVTLTVSC